MDPVRVGHSFRALRLHKRLRQEDLAAKADASPSVISRIERGRLESIPLGTLRRVAEALDATLDLRLRWNGEALDRLLDQAHADLVETLVQRLQAAGWVAEVEVSFAIRGERGAIDILGFHAATGIVLVAEVKSVVPDSQATLAGIDRKARLAPEIARSHGWDCRGVARVLAIGDSATSRRRIQRLGTTYRLALPAGGREVGRWLRSPDRPIAGILFLPFGHRATGNKATTGMQRVRKRAPAGTRRQTRTGRPVGGRGPAPTSLRASGDRMAPLGTD